MHLRLIDSCITQLKAQGPSRTCNESKEEEEKYRGRRERGNLGTQSPALEATKGQMDGFFRELPYKCCLEEVASVVD